MVLSNDMTDLDAEDSLTKLNTQLNKSMVLMDTTTEERTQQHKKVKSIRINTKIQPASPSNGSNSSRKSILKKPENTVEEHEVVIKTEVEEIERDRLSDTDHHVILLEPSSNPRPQTLQELMQEETLVTETTSAAFSLDDISDSEDIWIMDIPRTVDPQELKGQRLILGDKSKFKIKEEKYCAVHHEAKSNITCIFHTGKVKHRYKTVNIKPAGAITVRRKLPNVQKIKPIEVEQTGVPFPKNLKTRHPLFGVSVEGKVKKGAIKR